MRGSIGRQAWLVALSAGLGYLFDSYVVNIYSFVLPRIADDFSLSTTEQGAVGSALLAGYFLGTAGFGWLSDKLGRRPTLGASILVYGVTTGLSGLAPNAAVFGVLRFVTGTGGAGEQAVGVPYTAEEWPAGRRAYGAGGVIFSLFAVGALLAIVSALILAPGAGWRWTFLVAIVPALLVFALRRGISESAAYQDAHEATGPPAGALREVLTAPEHRRRLLIGSLIFIANAVGYWGFLVFLQKYLTTEFGLSFTAALGYTSIFFVAMAIWPWVGAWAAERFGRRPAGVAGGVLIAVASVIAFSTSSLTVFVLANVLGIGLLGWTWSVGQTYVAELWPTRVRGTGFGASVAIGRFPAIAGPLLTGTLIASIGFSALAKAFAVLWLLYVVAFLIGPETRGRELAELDADAGEPTGLREPTALAVA